MHNSGLTAFGLACRQHRSRMKTVMADQSIALDVPNPTISAYERGALEVPISYVKKLAGWMQLDAAEESELALLAKLKSAKQKIISTAETESLIKILDRMDIDRSEEIDG